MHKLSSISTAASLHFPGGVLPSFKLQDPPSTADFSLSNTSNPNPNFPRCIADDWLNDSIDRFHQWHVESFVWHRSPFGNSHRRTQYHFVHSISMLSASRSPKRRLVRTDRSNCPPSLWFVNRPCPSDSCRNSIEMLSIPFERTRLWHPVNHISSTTTAVVSLWGNHEMHPVHRPFGIVWYLWFFAVKIQRTGICPSPYQS